MTGADDMVIAIGYIKSAGSIHGNTCGLIKPRGAAGPVAAAWIAIQPRQGSDDSSRRDFANRAEADISHENVAGVIHRNIVRVTETRSTTRRINRAPAPG